VTLTVTLWNDARRAYARELIDRAPAGYVVTIGEPRRTSAQNRRFHAMVADLERLDPLGRRYTDRAYQALAMAANGHEPETIVGLDGELIVLGFKSSRLTVAQMSDIIEWLFWFGAQHGVVWSNEAKESA
jgi:hypothetical protein